MRASAYQLADESSTLQRAREEREARSSAKTDGKFEVTGDERLTGTFPEGLTDVVPTESSTTAAQGRMRVSIPAKTVLSDLPLKQEKATVPLQLVVNTGNIQIMTVASLEDRILRMLVNLERDHVKWMQGELHMIMNNPHSLATRHCRGQLTTCPNTKREVPDSHEYNEAIAAVADCATIVA